MSRRKAREIPLSQRTVPAQVIERCRPPLAVVLGSPAEVINLLSALDGVPATCYQMDLFQGDRLREALGEAGIPAEVVVLPDLWDLETPFQSVVYLPPRHGERELKIDMVEQAFQILKPRGTFVVWSSYGEDEFFPGLLKKIFGRTHAHALDPDTVLWCVREGERPRRRHEVIFQVRISGGPSCRFISRPGTFAYGRLDEGARALLEVVELAPGDRVVDIGCGCGTNGVFASQRTGPDGFIAFVDSNLRALALADLNAKANGVIKYETVASRSVEGLPEASFDVALANPPYFASGAIARLFVERAHALLKPKGRIYLVTKQPNEVAAVLDEVFGSVEGMTQRGYTILCS